MTAFTPEVRRGAPWLARVQRYRRARRVGVMGAAGCCLVGALASVGQSATATSPGLNGNLVVAAGIEGDLWSGRPDGTESRQLTSGPAVDDCPAVSPSGSLIAFFRSNDTGGYDLWVIDADGSNARQLTDFPDHLVVVPATGAYCYTVANNTTATGGSLWCSPPRALLGSSSGARPGTT